jgi:hypothetical protein
VSDTNVRYLPGASSAAERLGLNLSPDEVREAAGGYARPGDQLKALHARGFVRAWRRPGGPVILERAHHDAVVRGLYGRGEQSANDAPPSKPRPNRAALQQRHGKAAR